jgi:hypothetical protein
MLFTFLHTEITQLLSLLSPLLLELLLLESEEGRDEDEFDGRTYSELEREGRLLLGEV